MKKNYALEKVEYKAQLDKVFTKKIQIFHIHQKIL